MPDLLRTLDTLVYGGDYNPEQWPLDVQVEDVELMKVAGVDLVTLGVFSWAHLEPTPGVFTFEWLDEVIDRLHAAGIAVDLATATASPPPWLSHRHREILPQTSHGTTLWPGARQGFCPSSPVYRDHAVALCRQMAERYGAHPALRLWHVSNELGCHVARCYCDVSAAAFRTWLSRKYGDVERLNEAWGTAFWSQRYSTFEEVLPPRAAPAFPNPTQQLDFRRFSSDELLHNFVLERDVLHEVSPEVPVTTNFMVMEKFADADYFAWAKEVDVVSNDHYPAAHDPQSWRELAFSADLTRGVAGGAAWLLMEHSPSAVNWQPRNVAMRPGELARHSLTHVAHGSDGVLFFQWRASRAGAEKFHAGLVPHAGTDSRLWGEVVALGATLDRLDEIVGSRARNEVAILFDWSAWWACELDSHPSVDVTYLDRAHSLHRSLQDLGVGVDLVHPDSDLGAYRLILVPTLYSVTDAAAGAVAAAAERGASVLVTYFSGIVDEHDHVRLGGYPGAFRDLLGIRTVEFTPLLSGDVVRLSDGSTADVWTEDLRLAGATSVVEYVDGPVPGAPAVTRRAVGAGAAWYAACRLDQSAVDDLVARLVAEAGVRPVVATTPGVEVTRRVADDGRSWVFVINHTEEPAVLALSGHDLVGDAAANGSLTVRGGSVAVVREG